MPDNTIKDRNGQTVELSSRQVDCWEDAPGARCLVSYCTPETREIELIALHSGDTFTYGEWNGGKIVQKSYQCLRGLSEEFVNRPAAARASFHQQP